MASALTRILRSSLTALTLGLATAGSAFAQDADVCARLSAQLHDHVSDRGPTRHYTRYATAAEDLLQLMEQMEDDMFRLGCSGGSVIVYGDREPPQCKQMAATLKRMHADLRLFEKKRDAHAGRDGTQARERVIKALLANGCNLPGGIRIRRTLGVAGNAISERNSAIGQRYRTLCVRRCDGYYFPISYSTSPLNFEGDAARCKSMCPGANVELYFHNIPGQESEDMVSVSNHMPYRAMPFAFAYRDGKVTTPGRCSCNAPQKPIQTDAQSDTGSSIVKLTPKAKKSETVEEATVAEVVEPPARDLDPNQRVRVVGPKFLPDLSEAIDLQAQGRIERQ